MKLSKALRSLIVLILIAVYGISTNVLKAQNEITSPEQFFGFQMGEDRKLARWDKIVEYFYKVEKESDRLKVINMGPSSEGHPFLVLVISSADNLANLDKLQEINKAISDPRLVPEGSICIVFRF